jgi:hypothetical protein
MAEQKCGTCEHWASGFGIWEIIDWIIALTIRRITK